MREARGLGVDVGDGTWEFSGNTPMRDIISLACNECKRRNYSTTKNKKKTSERLEMSKYCRFCRKHTGHRETK